MSASEAAPEQRKADLVFEGGGVKGIGLVGALSVLEEEGWEPQSIAGTSAGAIVAVLLAAGYTAGELFEILAKLDFRDFEDEGWEDRIPLVGRPLSVIKDLGVYEGDYFLSWIAGLLQRKGVETFAQLRQPADVEDPPFDHRVQLVASDVTAREMLILPRDAVLLGIEPDDLSVAEAVRMSMSIPGFFEPWIVRNETIGEHLIVDGGLLSNFPVWLFDSPDVPRWPTVGLMLVEPDMRRSVAERLPARQDRLSSIDFVRSLLHTMIEAHDRMYVETSSFVRTIGIDTLGVRTTEFDLSPDRANALYESGKRAASAFLAGWDFDAYKAGFREGRSPTRRELIEATTRVRAEADGPDQRP